MITIFGLGKYYLSEVLEFFRIRILKDLIFRIDFYIDGFFRIDREL